ncbi:MAG: zinc-binding dehydrogenase [Thermoproteota archaeon]|nr:zinc-binding dehydrogenase [Thermoproteota archaeon]
MLSCNDKNKNKNKNRVFRLEEIVEAHRYMEENRAKGKLVVKVE